MRTIKKELEKAKFIYLKNELIDWQKQCKKHGDDCYTCSLRKKCQQFGGLLVPELDFKKIK